MTQDDKQKELDLLLYGNSYTDKETGERIDPQAVEHTPDGVLVDGKEYKRVDKPQGLMSAEALASIAERADKATEGPWGVGINAPDVSPEQFMVDQLRRRDSDTLWMVYAVAHPDNVGEYPKFAHTINPAVTGNGPTSEANAYFIAAARTDIPQLLAHIALLTEERDHYRAAYLAERGAKEYAERELLAKDA